MKKYLSVSKLRECVHNYTKDYVQSNGSDENEESDVKYRDRYNVLKIIIHNTFKSLKISKMK